MLSFLLLFIPSVTATDCYWLNETGVWRINNTNHVLYYDGECCNPECKAYFDENSALKTVSDSEKGSVVWTLAVENPDICKLLNLSASSSSIDTTSTSAPFNCSWLSENLVIPYKNGTNFEYFGQCCTPEGAKYLLSHVFTDLEGQIMIIQSMMNKSMCYAGSTTTPSSDCGFLEGTSCCNAKVTECLSETYPEWQTVLPANTDAVSQCGCDLGTSGGWSSYYWRVWTELERWYIGKS